MKQRVNARKGRRSISRGMESLEARQLLSAAVVENVLVVTGTDGNDQVVISSADTDVSVSVNGEVTAFAKSSFTSIRVSTFIGDDSITLGNGVPNTRVESGDHNDTIISGTGDDTLVGGTGEDLYVFRDNWGNDFIEETDTGDTDTMDFSAVDRNLLVVVGALNVSDTAGNSANHGESFIENVIGGSGNDTFDFQNNAAIGGVINGGGGINTLVYNAYTTGVTVDLAAGTATGTGGIHAIHNVFGGSGNDRLVGNAGNNNLVGGPGNDTLIGGGGNDVFFFGADSGSDEIDASGGTAAWDFSTVSTPLSVTIGVAGITVRSGGSVLATGNNIARVVGGQANDVFTFANGATAASTDLDGGAGVNTLNYQAYTTPVLVRLSGTVFATATKSITRFDNVLGGAGNDTLVGNASNNDLRGFGGSDRINGLAGNDVLRGGGGNDLLRGGDGNDRVGGDAGNDTLYGGAGNDRMGGGDGNDRLYGEAGADGLYGGNGNDLINGGTLSDFLSGDAGDDVLLARDNTKDTVRGGNGSDRAQRDEALDRVSTVERFI